MTDKMLQAAAAEAGNAIVAGLPAPEQCEHAFSRRFEREMRKLIRREAHPALYQPLRRVACLALAALMGSGIFLALNTEVRAAFFGWVKERYESFIVLFYQGNAPAGAEEKIVGLTWLPLGYRETETQELAGLTLVVYQNEDGANIDFCYSDDPDAESMFIEDENVTQSTVQIGKLEADLYMAQVGGASSAIVWTDENAVIYSISAVSSSDELIRMAESIAPIN